MKRTPLLRRTPLNRMSRKRRKSLGKRRECIEAVKTRSGGICEAKVSGVCTRYGCDGHEIVKRSAGGSPNDPANVLWICRGCHDWIHGNPREAKELGLLK